MSLCTFFVQAQAKPFLLLYRMGGLIEGGQAAAAALLKAKAKRESFSSRLRRNLSHLPAGPPL